jgi:hypothetical protein
MATPQPSNSRSIYIDRNEIGVRPSLGSGLEKFAGPYSKISNHLRES